MMELLLKGAYVEGSMTGKLAKKDGDYFWTLEVHISLEKIKYGDVELVVE